VTRRATPLHLVVPGCEAVRTHVSARIDGEVVAAASRATTQHLRLCPDCRRFEVLATELRRRLRVRPAPELRDLAGSIVQALDVAAPARSTAAP
jgi:predicted anti-sigma-YlaC factor YlaD